MAKRRLISTLLVLAIVLAAGMLIPACRWTLVGWVKRDSFYNGRPTSYWRQEIIRYNAEFAAWNQKTPFQSLMSKLQSSLGIKPRPPSYEELRKWADAHRAATPEILRDTSGLDAIPVWRELMKDKDEVIRRIAVVHLEKFGAEAEQAIPEVSEALSDADINVRLHASLCLWRITGRAEQALPVLVDALQDPGAAELAALCLEEMGPQAKPAVLPLTATLRSKQPLTKWAAARALAAIGPHAKSAVPDLVQIVQENKAGEEESPQTIEVAQLEAIRALGAIGSEAGSAVPALEEKLKDGNPEIRIAAAVALWKTAAERKPALAILGEAMQTPAGNEAAVALGDLGPAAKDASPLLLAALKAEQTEVRIASALALWKIEHECQQTVPVLIDALNDPDSGIRRQAIQALTTMGPVAQEAVPALIRELKGKYNRAETAQALGAIGPKAKPAVPVLKRALRDKNRPARLAVYDALEKIDPTALDSTDSTVSISPWVWVALGMLIGYGLWTVVKGRKQLAEGISTSFLSRPEPFQRLP